MRRHGRGRVILAGLAFTALATAYGLSAAADPGSMGMAGHRHMAQTKPGAPAPKAPASAPKVSQASKLACAATITQMNMPSSERAQCAGVSFAGRSGARGKARIVTE